MRSCAMEVAEECAISLPAEAFQPSASLGAPGLARPAWPCLLLRRRRSRSDTSSGATWTSSEPSWAARQAAGGRGKERSEVKVCPCSAPNNTIGSFNSRILPSATSTPAAGYRWQSACLTVLRSFQPAELSLGYLRIQPQIRHLSARRRAIARCSVAVVSLSGSLAAKSRRA